MCSGDIGATEGTDAIPRELRDLQVHTSNVSAYTHITHGQLSTCVLREGCESHGANQGRLPGEQPPTPHITASNTLNTQVHRVTCTHKFHLSLTTCCITILKGGGPEGPLALSFNLVLSLGLWLRDAEEERSHLQERTGTHLPAHLARPEDLRVKYKTREAV